MFKAQLLIFVIICIRNSSCGIKTTFEAGKGVWELHSMISNITSRSRPAVWAGDELFTLILQNREIRNQMSKIHEQLNQMDESMDSKVIPHSIEESAEKVRLLRCLDTFDLYVGGIDGFYKDLYQLMYISSGWQSTYRLGNLLPTIGQELESGITVIRTMMSDENHYLADNKNLASTIADYAAKHYAQLCNSPEIISNMLLKLFTIVMIAEIKVNIVVTFSNLYQYAAKNGWRVLNSNVKNKFRELFGNYVRIFEENIALADSLYLRACDPKDGVWIRDESFYEMERTFQTTVYSYHLAQCIHSSCNSVVSDHVKDCDVKFYNDGCSGTMAECVYLNSVHVCVLKRGPYKFQYVNSTELGSLGRHFDCREDDGFIIQDGRDWNDNYASCACNCYRDHNKVSLLIMKSAVKDNWVITGVRFLRQNRILYIQPKEGKVGASGYINKTSERWVPIPPVIRESDSHPITRRNRVFFLDDLRLLKGSVLTGVKFNKVTRENVTGFAIQIFGAPFDFESGRLNIDNIYGVSAGVSNETQRTALAFERISSLHTTSLNIVSPGEPEYISLERSKLEDDFGQATLPFFDAVKVEAAFSSPLDGIGIFHKGVEGYAGFISLRVYGISHPQDFRQFKVLHMEHGRVLFD